MKRYICLILCCLGLVVGSAKMPSFASDMGESFVEVSESGGVVMEKEGYRYKQLGNKYFVRADKNTEIVSALKEICKENRITAGTVSGLGAVKSVTFGFFNPETKEYKEKTFNEYMEITSLLGNVSQKDGEVYLHLHMNASGKDYKVIGGHLVKAVVSATSEIIIDAQEGTIGRKFSEDIGLNLFEF